MRQKNGFTLIELLVVISIIAILVALLLPALSKARQVANGAKSLSNTRQLSSGVFAYTYDERGRFPVHSSSSSPTHPAYANPRTRWPDYIWQYVKNYEVYLSPNLDDRELDDFKKQFAHTANAATPQYFGGYGYNFQYLGNSRPVPVFRASIDADIKSTGETVVLGDVAGSRGGSISNEPGTGAEAVYSLDPPLGSVNLGSKGNGKTPSAAYYAGGTDEPNGDADSYLWRSFPAERNGGSAAMSFVDGHGKLTTMKDIDDFDGDGNKDNGYWNGLGDATKR